MQVLYPDIKPYNQGFLAVQTPHEIYFEESGNPQGIPVLFVHGGPGSGCTSQDRCFFDPEKYRIILFDQRGAGRSKPHAELVHNNTHALIEDMEALRQHLSVEQWLLFGGSWGSTLSLGCTAKLTATECSVLFCAAYSYAVRKIWIGFTKVAPPTCSRITGKRLLNRFQKQSAAICCRPITSG